MLVRLVLNPQPCDPPASASQSAGITGLSQCAWLGICFLKKILNNVLYLDTDLGCQVQVSGKLMEWWLGGRVLRHM